MTNTDAAVRPSGLEATAWLLLPACCLALVFRFSFAERLDWLGHFLAGFGATLVLVLAALRLTRGRPGTVFAATALATGLGWLAEQSVFALAGPDPLDFHAQTLGAGLAGLGLLLGRGEETPALPSLLLAGLSLAVGGAFALLA